jgi:hypothetical protein
MSSENSNSIQGEENKDAADLEITRLTKTAESLEISSAIQDEKNIVSRYHRPEASLAMRQTQHLASGISFQDPTLKM